MRTKLIDDYLYANVAVEKEIAPSGEINGQVNYIGSMFNFLDNATEALDNLEDVEYLIRDHQVGTADKYTAKIVSVSLSNSFKHLGINHNEYSLSKEAFDNDGLRKIEFEMTAEAVSTVIRDGWNALINFFKSIMAKIGELWKTYTKATEHLKMLVKNSRQKLLSYNSVDDVDDTFTDKSIAIALKIGDQLAITDQIQNTLKLCSVVMPVNQVFTKIIKDVEADTEAGDTQKQTFETLDIKGSLGNAAQSVIEITDTTEKETLPDIKDSNRLLGNGVVVAYIGKSESVTIDIEKIIYNKDVTDFELNVAHKEDMNRYLASLSKIIMNIEQLRNKVNSDSKSTLAELDAIGKKMKKIKADEKKAKEQAKKDNQKPGNGNGDKNETNNNGNNQPQTNNQHTNTQTNESYHFSSEANEPNKPGDKNENNNKGPKVTDGKLEIDKKEVEDGTRTYSKEAIKTLKELIKAKGKVSYLSTKLMIDGCYKLISYIDKSLAYYSRENT